METWILFVIFAVSLLLLFLFFYFIPIGLWFTLQVTGVNISLMQLIMMRWRKIDSEAVVEAMIVGTKAGIGPNFDELEAHALVGGNVKNVMYALVAAKKAGIELDFNKAAAIDLAGINVFETVQKAVLENKTTIEYQ